MKSKKIKSLRQLKKIVEGLKKKGRKIVFTNGCFDILHAGHLYSLEKARKLGDVLIVGINSDSSVRKLKGRNRPVINEKDRSYLVSGFYCVDYCVIFENETPIHLIRTLKPDIIVKGADYKKEQIVGAEDVKAYGGKVVRMRLLPGRSTSSVIKKIHETG
ncbi:MAG: D-glycero-beta-D-manno-heptose 1-phosphate adenylyltransferase [Candidatus Omnitrophica bacterium]|nr:D-glycero-beta-D-manno-heptose 1-phosphate adenylyltransferase [Candidatus Omnitrophota bacterium]